MYGNPLAARLAGSLASFVRVVKERWVLLPAEKAMAGYCRMRSR